MFKDWTKVAVELNSNRTNTSIEKAKKISKKYIIKGRLLKILGIISIIVSLSSFIAFSIIGNENFIPILIVLGLLFPVSAALIGFGATYSRLGAKLAIAIQNPPIYDTNTDFANSYVSENSDNKCPYCGDKISIDSLFCSNCGRKLKNTCPKCGHINDSKNRFCEKCGADLRF